MSRYALIPSCKIVILFPLLAGFASATNAATDARVSESYGKLPLHFEANRGQTDKDVRFLSRGPGYSLYLTANEAVLVLAKPDAKGDARTTHDRRTAPTRAQSVALRTSLVGAARKPAVTGVDELPGKANYFIGKDPAKWRTDVPTYAKVHYGNVYPGIDLVYYGNQRQLEYDFIVAPGADPKKIAFDFKGADKLEIDAQGELVLHTAGGDIRQHKPIVYQEIDGARRDIAGGYVRKGANRVGLQVATYDTTRPLIIDPVLSYSTYLGGSDFDSGRGIAVDADGNAFVTGCAPGAFPTTSGAFQRGGGGAFVTKLDPTGSALVYSTALGSGGNDCAFAIAVDADGNAYVTGATFSTNFPTTVGAFQAAYGGFGDAFVTKLNPTGSALVYSSYLGGNNADWGGGIAVDGQGNAYVAGMTASGNFTTTAGAFQPISSGVGGAFVTKLDPVGSVVYSTYLGGNGNESAHGISVDVNGSAYVIGITDSLTFPTTPGAFQRTYGGGNEDVFVTKLDPTGSALVYSSYLGGTRTEYGYGIAVDPAGNAYVTGQTSSADFPTTVGAFQTTYGGTTLGDAFVTKINPTGSALVYSTFLGGTGSDTGYGIAADADGNAYVTGATDSPAFPTTPGAFQPIHGGGYRNGNAGPTDGFFTKLDSTGSVLVYSTFLGGNGNDSGAAVAVDSGGNGYVTGVTDSINFPTTPGAFQPTFAGSIGPFGHPPTDAFVVRIVDIVHSALPAAPMGSN
jgi:Beta-propeller repeat